MSIHIMNDVSRMTTIRNRNGLNIKTNSNATSEYIRMRQVQKSIKNLFLAKKAEFEEKYRIYNGYDYIYINSFVDSLAILSNTKLENVLKGIETEGLDVFLLKKMNMNPNNLILRQTKPTDY